MSKNFSLASLVTVAVLSLAAAASQAQTPAKGQSQAVAQFDLPPQSLAAALRAIGSQMSTNVLFDPPLVEGLKAPALKAELTVDQAFARLLAGSGLKHRFLDEKTVMVISSKDTTSGKPTAGVVQGNLMRSAAAVQPAEARDVEPQGVAGSKTEKQASDTSAEILVNDTRIDGLNNKGLLQGGRDGALYHDVITREDIERMGVTSMEELFRLLPQTSSASTSLQAGEMMATATGGDTIRFSQVGLRGFRAEDTVILINGRALPRAAEYRDTSGADLSRIPMAAIERIEILPYAGSAVYGSGAIGGAINIILRKDFSGQSLDVYFGKSTEGGADEQRLNFLDGRTFNDGRTSLTTSFAFQHREPLTLGERDYLERAYERFGPDSGVITLQGRPAFEQYMLPALAGAPGVIVLDSATGDLGIPGRPGARYASVPTGTTPAASLSLTPASFTATAGQPNLANRYGRSNIYQPVDTTTLVGQLEHEFIKDRLSAYAEVTVSYNRRNYTYPQALAVKMDANHPLNPFRNGVTSGFQGRGVTLYLDAPDTPDSGTISEGRSKRAVLGLKGRINEDWEWSGDVAYDRTRNTFTGIDPTSRIGSFSAYTPSSTNPLPGTGTLQQRFALYPVLADHNVYPTSAADIARYFQSYRRTWTEGDQKEINARLTGEVFDLPAGPLKISTTGKLLKWKSGTGQWYDDALAGNPWIGLPAVAAQPFWSAYGNDTWQGTMEFAVPIIGGKWRPIPIESLELQGSASYESIDVIANMDAPNEATRRNTADSQAIAIKFAPTRDIAFRASYTTAFTPPRWSEVTGLVSTFSFNGAASGITDAARGGELVGIVDYSTGPNENLQPETAKSTNFGVMLTPRFLPGFDMNLNYFRIRREDAIVAANPFNVSTNPNWTLGVTRAPASATDQAAGRPGPITAFQRFPFNSAGTETEGVDVRMSQALETSSNGSFLFNVSATFTNNFRQQDFAVTPWVNQINTLIAPLKWRGMGSISWIKGQFNTSVTGRYTGYYYTAFTAPSEAYPSANRFDGDRIPASLLWDLQMAYEYPGSGGGGLGQGLLAGTRWTLGVNNVLNEEPPYATGQGTGFYSTNSDPRQRFVYFQLRKAF